MALRPGNFLLISSHFMPDPRNLMISASSTGDHFDSFFASVPVGYLSAGKGRLFGAVGEGCVSLEGGGDGLIARSSLISILTIRLVIDAWSSRIYGFVNVCSSS